MAYQVRSQDWLARHARSQPRTIALIDLGNGRELTYAMLNERAERLAVVLGETFGIVAGDRLAILSENTSNIFEVQFACWKLGAAYVPLNWRLARPELEFIVRDCAPKLLFHDAVREDVAAVLAGSCDIASRICWGGPTTGAADGTDYEHLLASASSLASIHRVGMCLMVAGPFADDGMCT